ncbi:predicted protein [Lichtheimia corymbifera JMRC:FSU:9682]|uniref:Uncharacterized protein n=1 Tax=Lichtheimia corymbifera JMRC:FSU:9682 TaxID=1263082 RepID=A0A068RLD2_9FUNG|nr:predicted protein [Lichtheimia corymbifera JMRC:FSU:9682]
MGMSAFVRISKDSNASRSLLSLGRSDWDAHDLITQHVWYNLEHRAIYRASSQQSPPLSAGETINQIKLLSCSPFSRYLIVNVNAIKRKHVIFSRFFVLHNMKTKEASGCDVILCT